MDYESSSSESVLIVDVKSETVTKRSSSMESARARLLLPNSYGVKGMIRLLSLLKLIAIAFTGDIESSYCPFKSTGVSLLY